MDILMIAVALIAVHNVDGDTIAVNPDLIVTLHPTKEATGSNNRLVTPGVSCVIGLSNGKFISVVETCAVVRKAMEDAK